MPDEKQPACCPGCGKCDCFDSCGVVVAYDPRANLTFPNGPLRPEVVERKYQCRLCHALFSMVEQPGK